MQYSLKTMSFSVVSASFMNRGNPKKLWFTHQFKNNVILEYV